MSTTNMNTCRFCGESEFGANADTRLVKYGRRHYAHHACYLDAGKLLTDLHGWQVGSFPFRLLQDRGLLEQAEHLAKAEYAAILSAERVGWAVRRGGLQ